MGRLLQAIWILTKSLFLFNFFNNFYCFSYIKFFRRLSVLSFEFRIRSQFTLFV